MNISKDTIIRTALFFVLLMVMDIFYLIMLIELLKHGLVTQEAAMGYSATGGAANAAAIRAWWKNNSFTKAAIEADNKKFELQGLKMIADGVIQDNIQIEEEYAAAKAAKEAE